MPLPECDAQLEARRDVARLLYVTLTRARERLVWCWYKPSRGESFQTLVEELADDNEGRENERR